MVSDPYEHFQSGQISDAVTAATEAVRNQPSDVVARSLLAELLCFSGDLERADKQLDAVGELDSDAAAVGVSLLRHLIRSELCRREVYESGRVPEFLTQPDVALQTRLRALISLRDGNAAEAADQVATAREQETAVSGECDGNAFVGMTDLDDLLGPTMEVYTATGKYYWLSLSQIVSLEMKPIQHLSDQLWRSADIETVGDVSGHVHVPALYYGSHTAGDQRLSIGRSSDWQERHPGLTCGLGQREWLLGDDVVSINSVATLSFAQPAADE
jgi:type VI secretion system protein ImpE